MDIDLNMIKKMLPKTMRSNVSEEFVDKLTGSCKDKEIAKAIVDNFITYSNVIKGGGYSLDEYMNAIRFISYKLLDFSVTDAYMATFPDRCEEYRKKGRENWIGNYASMYNRTKLVNQIFEQTMIPTYVLNAPLHQEAINTLAEMINDPKVKGMVKVKACEAILNYTKKPDTIKSEININVEHSNVIGELRDVTEQLAATLQKSLKSGERSLKEIADTSIMDAEIVEN